MQPPTIGRIVHYVLSSQDGTSEQGIGQHRAAVVVRTWPVNKTTVQLQVLTDGTNDRSDGKNVIWVTSVIQDEETKEPRTWHWPERED